MKNKSVLLERDMTIHELLGCDDKFYHLLDSLYNVAACSTCLDQSVLDRLERLIGKVELLKDILADITFDI